MNVRIRKRVFALLCTLLAWGASAASVAGETLFANGAVRTADPARPRAEAVLVRDGRIREVGANAEVSRHAGGARQLRPEDEIGVIAPGRQADLVVLERGLFQEPPHRIHSVRVDMTMPAGRIVYGRDGAGP